MTREEAAALLAAKGQSHVLRWFDELTEEQQQVLLAQIEAIDWDVVALATPENAPATPEEASASSEDCPASHSVTYAPIPAVEIPEIEARREEFTQAGLEAIRAGKVGAVLLAGGMGTRLGLDKPKGELNVGITRTLYLFERLVNNLQDVTALAGVSIPLYIMTSEKNHEDTVSFFEEHDFFGYNAADVHFYKQEMAVAVDFDGKILLEEKGRLATSPNGNGGWFTSLAKAGLLDDVHARGVEWLNIFAVDNVMQRICDPAFIGATLLSGKNSGSKVVRKVEAYEKMGVICAADGVPAVVEYIDLTPEMAESKDEKGDWVYAFGVILNYLFRVEKLEEVMRQRIPVHVVEKKIPYVDENGEFHKPEAPNGHKFESLAVDLVALMEDTLPYEVVRGHEFAPIKNLHGVDSLDSARELLTAEGVQL